MATRSYAFIDQVKQQMRSLAIGRNVGKRSDGFELRDNPLAYNALFYTEKIDIAGENRFFWMD